MRIELHDVWKRFGSALALQGVRLDVASGERVGLIGPNGSGKSTLLRALLGLLVCDGDIRLDGKSAFEHRVDIAKKLAYVPQTAPHWGAPVSEVVASIAALRDVPVSRVVESARRLGLELPAIHDRPFRNLSGGMKQKLLIAIALSSDATLFVLDEPTASLDTESRDRFLELLDEAAPKATKLFCSHRRDELVEHVDRVVALAEGKVVFDGSSERYLAALPAPRPARGPDGKVLLSLVRNDLTDAVAKREVESG